MAFVPAALPPASPSPEAWCFAFVGGQLLVPDDADAGEPLRPLAAGLAFQALAGAALRRHYLGTLAGRDCWALALPEPLPGWRPQPLRAALMALQAAAGADTATTSPTGTTDGSTGTLPGTAAAAPRGVHLGTHLGALAGRAAQVLEWDRSHAFCGVCGTATMPHASERARVCPACGHTAYPRLSPAMMALVWRPGELLLARAPHFARGMYSALAGFVEPGESLEDCLHREVAEEVGLAVADLRYYGSQSWPFPHSLMLAFTARWAGGDIVPQPGEIEDAQWFPIDALPGLPPPVSIAGHLIRDTVQAMRDGRWQAA